MPAAGMAPAEVGIVTVALRDIGLVGQGEATPLALVQQIDPM
jgi:hypothetical protein